MSRKYTFRVGGGLMPLVSAVLVAACGGGQDASGGAESMASGIDGRVKTLEYSASQETGSSETAQANLDASASSAGAVTSGTLLQGKMLRRGLKSGCTPSAYSDFIDGDTWNNRRLVPVDCAQLEVQAPLFSWRVPFDFDETKPWTFTLRRSSGEVVFSAQVTHPRLQVRQSLASGDYTWTVSYKRDRGDHETITSAARRFYVPADASSFIPPEGSVLAAQVARKSRPHVLPSGASFSTIAGKAKSGEYAQRYTAFIKGADTLLAAPVPVEPPAPDAPTNSKAYKDWKNEVASIAREEHKNINTLSFAWRFTGDARYRDAAKAHVVGLAKWSPTGGSGYATNDLASGDISTALSRGLDVLDTALSSSERQSVAASIKARLEPALAEFAALDATPYDSHNVRLVRDTLNALLAAAGSFPEAEGWLASTWDIYTETLATWGGDDGSWGNGNGYGWYMFDRFGEALASVRLVAGVDLSQSTWVRRVGDTLIANTAPAGTHMSAFGDDAENTDNYSMYARDLYRLYAAVTRQPRQVWYWKVGEAQTSKDAVINPFHFMLLSLDQAEVAAAAPTKTSYIFTDAGVVAMHDNVTASDRSSVFFRSSRFGSHNHSHADQNAFTLVSKGKDVLISGGYYPYYMSPHHATVTRATRYKNALTFDGGIGQAEPVKSPTAPGKPIDSMDTRGELVNYKVSGNWTVATGDATLAYRGWDSKAGVFSPLLSNAIRSIAYNRVERVIVIYDWATSNSARRWELNFNSLEPFTANGTSAKATGMTSSACIDVYGGSGTFSTSKGFAVPPEGNYPTQYQAHYKAGTATTQLVAVTVIRESCRSVPVAVNTSGTSASVTVNGGPALNFDQRTMIVP